MHALPLVSIAQPHWEAFETIQRTFNYTPRAAIVFRKLGHAHRSAQFYAPVAIIGALAEWPSG